jgi:hypothetical protein
MTRFKPAGSDAGEPRRRPKHQPPASAVLICGRGRAVGVFHAFGRFHRLKAAGEVAPPGAIAAADLFGLFLDAAKASTAPRTYEYYRDRLKPFGQSLGRRKAEDLKPLHVTQWMDAHPTWGQATRRAVVVAARRACCWGVEQGLIDVDPLARLKRPRMPRRRGITAEDAARIAAAGRTGDAQGGGHLAGQSERRSRR